ncbi:hypothetical protein CHS0354_030090 [Potamilus streckersoni]|uniref:SSD domain-containing protein n=1 Tax=Potamilus streckersoni TaxID=2493646 RepID=A0AAE0VDG5_9BIVA|nr:hypothetical protein CHS0354_030090 [Potamilus streckersoni]
MSAPEHNNISSDSLHDDNASARGKIETEGKELITPFPLTALAVKKFKWVYLLLVSVIISGLSSYSSLPKEWAPDVQFPLLIVSTPFPQSTPEDVENLITSELEKELRGIKGLKKISSVSSEGISVIRLEFELGFDVSEARNKARDALDKVKADLPADAEDSTITEINISERPIMVVSLTGKLEMDDMTEIADKIKDELEIIPGVLEVKRSGGTDKEIQIYADADKLKYYGISLSKMGNAIKQENQNLPLGKIDNGPMSLIVRVVGEIKNPENIGDIVIATYKGVPIYVRDVAQISFTKKELTTLSRLDSGASVSISISKRAGENLQLIAANVKKIVEEYRAKHSDTINIKLLSDQSVEVNARISDLENNIYTGLILVVAVLMFFMGIVNAVFVGIAVPLSMLMSFLVLRLMGISLNFVVLFGLILGLGMLVDNAIVIVENIYRHFQMGKTRKESAIQGVSEVAYPVISSTLTTVAAFFPLIYMPGIVGQFISYLPKTVIITLLCSLFVALFFNPVICATIMKRPKKAGPANEIEIVNSSKVYRIYMNALRACLRHPLILMSVIIVSFVGLIAFYIGVIKAGVEFFPKDEPSEAVINISAPFGTNLAESDRIVRKVEEIIAPYSEYTASIESNIGSSRSSSSAGGGGDNSYITIAFPEWDRWKVKPKNQHPDASTDDKNNTREEVVKPTAVITAIREDLKKPENQVAGADIVMELSRSGPPGGKSIEMEISGPDLTVLKEISEQIKARIYNFKGLVNLKDDLQLTRSEIVLSPDRESISAAGISAADISRELRTALSGTKVSSYRVGKDDYDIVVRYTGNFRESIDSINSIYVYNVRGEPVALSDLIKIESQASYGAIRHKDRKRTLTLSADAEGATGANLLTQVRKELSDLELPAGYTLRYGGEDEDRGEIQVFLMRAFIIALLLIFLIILWDFESLIMTGVIMLTIPLSVMGVVLGLIIHAQPFSIVMGGIAVVSLAGIVVNNGIVMLDYIKYMRSKGYNLIDSIVITGALRLRPIFLTASTTILGMMPLLFGMDINFYRFPNIVVFGAGSGAIWRPLANATAYGLLISTLITLFFIPTMYYLLVRVKAFVFKTTPEEIHKY